MHTFTCDKDVVRCFDGEKLLIHVCLGEIREDCYPAKDDSISDRHAFVNVRSYLFGMRGTSSGSHIYCRPCKHFSIRFWCFVSGKKNHQCSVTKHSKSDACRPFRELWKRDEKGREDGRVPPISRVQDCHGGFIVVAYEEYTLLLADECGGVNNLKFPYGRSARDKVRANSAFATYSSPPSASPICCNHWIPSHGG